MLENLNLKRKYSPIPFIVFLTAFSVLIGVLLYYQATQALSSDISAHISIAMGALAVKPYSLFHFLLGFGLSIVNRPKAITTLLLVACVIAPILMLRYFVFNSDNDSVEKKYSLDFFSAAMGIVSMIVTYLPVMNGYWYLGQGTSNPWHNPTYIICKPFSLVVFILFVKLYNNYLKGVPNKPLYYTLFCIFSMLSMSAKPSFLSAFMPACCAFLFFELIRTKGKSFCTSALIGVAYVPSLFVLLQQNSILFDPSLDSAVMIGLGNGWKEFSSNIPLSILLSVAFPLYILLCNFKRLEFTHKLGYLTLLFSALEYYFIYESGSRAEHANFAWGFYFGVFMAFVAAVDLFLKKEHTKAQSFIALSVFQWHLFSGILYIQSFLFINKWT